MYRSVPMHVPPIVPLNPKVQIAANRVQFKQLVGTSLQGRVMSANKPISMDGSERERKCELLSAGIQFDLSMFPKTPEHPAVRLLRYCAGLPRGSLGPPGKAPGKGRYRDVQCSNHGGLSKDPPPLYRFRSPQRKQPNDPRRCSPPETVSRVRQ
jgi:hypothetical protein